MSTPLTVVLIAVAVAIAGGALVVLRTGSGLPWPLLGFSALTCAVCFTVGGATGADLKGPDLATVMGALVGVATIAAAIIALVPRDADVQGPSRVPPLLATAAAVIGCAGLVISVLTT
jgi:peptidoglycan/LPS O-acetylase OafA/YrhL